jgi:hypothetical protein
MNLMDKVIIKDGDTFIENIFYLRDNFFDSKYIFTSEDNLVYDEGLAVIWEGSVGSKAIRPLKADLPYTKIDETTYELDIAPYKHGPLTMADLF